MIAASAMTVVRPQSQRAGPTSSQPTRGQSST